MPFQKHPIKEPEIPEVLLPEQIKTMPKEIDYKIMLILIGIVLFLGE